MRLRAGRCYEPNEPNGMIVSDALLRRLGVKEPPEALGREIEVATLSLDFSLTNLLRMAFSREGQTLPFARESYRFTIVGVAERMPLGGMSDAYIQPQAVRRSGRRLVTRLSPATWDYSRRKGSSRRFSTHSRLSRIWY